MKAPDWNEIERESTGLSIRSARFIGEGWNARAYLVNEQLVFRFPKHAGHWRELDREMTFLAFASSKLPVATPKYEHARPYSRGSAWGYAIYQFIPGGRFNPKSLDKRDRERAAEAIAGFLKSMHSFRLEPPLTSLLPSQNELDAAREYLSSAERDIIPRLPTPAGNRLFRVFETYLSESSRLTAPLAVLHADLSAEHILMDGSAVTGVIDFGDVNWGDPDYDFMYLYTDFGIEFVREVALRYGHPDLGRLRRKLVYFGIVDQIDTILENEGRSLAGQKELAWGRLHQLLESETF